MRVARNLPIRNLLVGFLSALGEFTCRRGPSRRASPIQPDLNVCVAKAGQLKNIVRRSDGRQQKSCKPQIPGVDSIEYRVYAVRYVGNDRWQAPPLCRCLPFAALQQSRVRTTLKMNIDDRAYLDGLPPIRYRAVEGTNRIGTSNRHALNRPVSSGWRAAYAARPELLLKLVGFLDNSGTAIRDATAATAVAIASGLAW